MVDHKTAMILRLQPQVGVLIFHLSFVICHFPFAHTNEIKAIGK